MRATGRVCGSAGLLCGGGSLASAEGAVIVSPCAGRSAGNRVHDCYRANPRSRRRDAGCAAARGDVPPQHRRAGDPLDQRALPRAAADERAAHLQLSPVALLGELRLSRRAVLHLGHCDRRFRDRRADRDHAHRAVALRDDGRARRLRRCRRRSRGNGVPQLDHAAGRTRPRARARLAFRAGLAVGGERRGLSPVRFPVRPLPKRHRPGRRGARSAPYAARGLGPHPAAPAAGRRRAALQRAAEARLYRRDLRAAAADGARPASPCRRR